MRWVATLAAAGLGCLFGSVHGQDAEVGVAPVPDPLPQRLLVCQGLPQVFVRASVARDARAACDGAARSLAFLARAGLTAPPRTDIDIVPVMPGELAGRAVGCYLRETKRIALLSFEAFESGGGWFRVPPSLELYRAAAAHEVAHSVVGCHSEPRRLAVAAHEYVAYVVFFATMDPSLRAEVLRKFAGRGFQNPGQISDLSHFVEPNQFGVDAWRHYLRVANRAQWLRRVIAGEVVPDLVEDADASTR